MESGHVEPALTMSRRSLGADWKEPARNAGNQIKFSRVPHAVTSLGELDEIQSGVRLRTVRVGSCGRRRAKMVGLEALRGVELRIASGPCSDQISFRGRAWTSSHWDDIAPLRVLVFAPSYHCPLSSAHRRIGTSH